MTAIANKDATLTEALALLSITHKPSLIEGKRDWFSADGKHLGAYDAAEGWAKLKDQSKEAGK